MEDKRAVIVNLDTIQKIKSYCFLIGRFYEKNPNVPKAPKMYFCPECKNPSLVHILGEYNKAKEEWRCPLCGPQAGPDEAMKNVPITADAKIVKPHVNGKVETINGLVARAEAAGNQVEKDVNKIGQEVDRPKRFDCPVCKAHAEKVGKVYTKSAIRVKGKNSGLCCTKSMAPFGSGCRGWYPDVAQPVVAEKIEEKKPITKKRNGTKKAPLVKPNDIPELNADDTAYTNEEM